MRCFLKRPRIGALSLLTLFLAPAAALGSPTDWISGWGERVTGQVLDYHSAQRNIDQALLVRSVDADRFIEWDTAPAPGDIEGEYATFVWLFGIDANTEVRGWRLAVNGRERPACWCFQPFPSSAGRYRSTYSGRASAKASRQVVALLASLRTSNRAQIASEVKPKLGISAWLGMNWSS